MRTVRLGAGRALAARLERIAMEELRQMALATERVCPECSASLAEIAGGLAAFLGADSPLNGTLGMGFEGRVSHSAVQTVESFFKALGATAVVNASSLASSSLELGLREWGWQEAGTEDVMVRPVSARRVFRAPDGPVEVRIAESAKDRELWVHVAANGFVAPDDPTPGDLRLCRAAASRTDVWLLLAFIGGSPAGAAELAVRDGVAWLSTDATLPTFRRRGVQTALQIARLQIAAEKGCELAVSEALPDSGSRRNMVRLGFRHAYSRREWRAPESNHERASQSPR